MIMMIVNNGGDAMGMVVMMIVILTLKWISLVEHSGSPECKSV